MTNTVRFCSAVLRFNNESLPQCAACIAGKLTVDSALLLSVALSSSV